MELSPFQAHSKLIFKISILRNEICCCDFIRLRNADIFFLAEFGPL
jgi:hypothetical protein